MKTSACHFLLFVFLCQILSCGKGDQGSITGDLKGSKSLLEGKMVFLKDWGTRKFVDSCRVTNGKFHFTKTTNAAGFPFRATIYYETGRPEWPHQPLGIRNSILKKNIESTIYAENAGMHLTLDTIYHWKNSDEVVFKIDKPGEQTEVAFRHLQFKIGSPDPRADWKHNQSLVARYPGSLELLDMLNLNKASFDSTQLSQMIGGFQPGLQKHPSYTQITTYLSLAQQTNTDFPAAIPLLQYPKGPSVRITDEKKPWHLVVFWASWCGPCRAEIPQIKKLHQARMKNLSISSISIDADQEQWKKALAAEKMPWKQYFVSDPSTLAILDKKYDLRAIPVWILLDNQGKLIKRHMGFEPGESGVDEVVTSLID